MLTAIAVAALLAGQTAPAPQTPAEEPSVSIEDIIVDGRPLVERARDYVDEIAAPPRNRSLASWHDKICVGTVNMPTTHAQAMIDRVSMVAQYLGVRADDPGCDPRVLIVMTDDAAGVAAQMVQRWPTILRPNVSGSARGEGDLDAFVQTAAPVRWWHVSATVDAGTGAPVMRQPGEAPPQVAKLVGATRLRSQYRDDMRKVFIVIDVDDIANVSFEQLTDYVAFITLAQVDPDGDTSGFDTILNLFKGGASAGLTAWDMAYLEALYKSDASGTSANRHDNQIGHGLARQFAGQMREEERREAATQPAPAPEG